jgi:hypothetical protein
MRFTRIVAASCLALASSAFAAEPSQNQAQSGLRQQQQSSDQQFIRNQLGYCEYQVQSARLADTHAQDDKIKSAAREQMKQAQASLQKYQQVAQAQNIRPQDATSANRSDQQSGSASDAKNEKSATSQSQWMSPIHQAMLTELSSQSGQSFDRCWTFQQAALQRYSALECQWQSKNAQSPEIKQLASQMASGTMEQESKMAALANSFSGQEHGATAGQQEKDQK